MTKFSLWIHSMTIINMGLVHCMNQNEVDRLSSLPPVLFRSQPGYHPITAIEREEELFNAIAHFSDVWFDRFINGSLSSWAPVQTSVRYREGIIPLVHVTNSMVERPFLIAIAMVDILVNWYDYEYHFGDLSQTLGLDFDIRHELHSLTVHIRTLMEIPESDHARKSQAFAKLSYSLDTLDGIFRSFTGFGVEMFQRWLYFDLYVEFTSGGKLKIVDKFEGAQAHVFKVESTNQQFYAL